MTIQKRLPQRHPSDETLLTYASGTLGAAHRFVVATHVLRCPDCRVKVEAVERVGGVLLDDLAGMPLQQPDALQLCLRRVEDHESCITSTKRLIAAENRRRAASNGVSLPQLFQDLRPGKLRWLAPGLQHATLMKDQRGTLHLVRVKPGVTLPPHTHRGLELTCVLEGAFHDANGHYLVGDVAETGDEDEEAKHPEVDHHHLVTADTPADCVCVIATSGRLNFVGWLAQVLQPIMPF
jgi:putative transcriptional regulator